MNDADECSLLNIFSQYISIIEILEVILYKLEESL